MRREAGGQGGEGAGADFPLLVIVGPTAVGKTALSLRLAAELDGEIVSADSRLFYQGMDIGTAKPTAAEQAAVPHHLIDVCRPDETLTLATYQRLAYATIDQILGNGRLPILVGGTGQYVRAVVEGWGIPGVAPQPELRRTLAALDGPELARWLRHLDPTAAEKLDPRNVRRVIRALEVTLVKGRPISELQRKSPPPYRICQVGLHRKRETLYRRIDGRVDQMMADGLLAEVEGLRARGYGRSLPSMSGLGYQQLWAYLAWEMSVEEAVERIKFETHRFARQQATWFRRDDPAITWFEMADDGVETAVLTFARNWLNSL
ncbi:MAG: tRNA (adenosine(37)-N6)-dimethylallyltransferase MiaA [Chloroflexi bacterium]|nr:tRNA (adenosine(37)-N6)-dimethylallyltransferase MiaA [Chloroflexota bacterium]